MSKGHRLLTLTAAAIASVAAVNWVTAPVSRPLPSHPTEPLLSLGSSQTEDPAPGSESRSIPARKGERRLLGLFPRPHRPTSFRDLYGSNPLHLLLIVTMGALAGFAVLHWLHAPTPVRLLVWFAAAVIAHDLIAFPIYTGLDRLIIRAIAGRNPGPVISHWRRAAINHLRAPTLVSVLLLIMWYPLILKRSDTVYFRASGQHQSRYLGNWLLVVAILFATSLLIYLARLTYAAARSDRKSGFRNSFGG